MNDLESYEISAARRESAELAREQYNKDELRIRDLINSTEACAHTIYSKMSAIIFDHYNYDYPASAEETAEALKTYLDDVCTLKKRVNELHDLLTAKSL